MEIALAISILSIVITIANFVIARKDKAVKDTKEATKENANVNSDQKLIDYRLTQVENKLDKILDILDNYEKEMKNIVQEELDKHVLKYHK